MTKLESEILRAISHATRYKSDASPNSQLAQAIAAAEVAKRYIESALSDAFNQAHYSHLHPDVVKRMEYNEWANKWLKENGIIE